MNVSMMMLVPITTCLKNNGIAENVIDAFMPKTTCKKVGKRYVFSSSPVNWNPIKEVSNISDENILEMIELAKKWQSKSSKEIFNYKF
jgi:hypothetical protein